MRIQEKNIFEPGAIAAMKLFLRRTLVLLIFYSTKIFNIAFVSIIFYAAKAGKGFYF